MPLCRCSPTLMLLLAVALFAGAGQTLAANATVGGRRGLLGVCDHCNVPLCQGGCKCDNQCNCLTTTNSGANVCDKCNVAQSLGGCKCDSSCSCLSGTCGTTSCPSGYYFGTDAFGTTGCILNYQCSTNGAWSIKDNKCDCLPAFPVWNGQQCVSASGPATLINGFYFIEYKKASPGWPNPSAFNMGIWFSSSATMDVGAAFNEYLGTPLPALPSGSTTWLCLGGGSSVWTQGVVNSINSYLQNSASTVSRFTGIAFDVEQGQGAATDLYAAFRACFATARAHGLQVLITTSGSEPYSWSAGAGNDPHVLMQSFLADPNVNYISPQMYGPGLDYPSSNIAGYDWQAGWKTTPAKIVLSLTSAGDYNNYVPLFQGLGIPLAGLVVFTE